VKLWFRAHARTNIVLAVLATIAAALSRPFKRLSKRTRQGIGIGVLAAGVAVMLTVTYFAVRSPGPQLVHATEAPTSITAVAPSTTTSRVAAPRDTSPPALLLDGDIVDGLTIGTDHLVISGLTDAHTTVAVADLEVTADATGAWAVDVPLALGANRIEVVATDAAGNRNGFTLTVVYEIDAPPPPKSTRALRRVVTTTTSTVKLAADPSAPATTLAPATLAPATLAPITLPAASTSTTGATSSSSPSSTGSDGGSVAPTSGPTATTQEPTTTPPTSTIEPSTTTTEPSTTTTEPSATTTEPATSTTETTIEASTTWETTLGEGG
jgi:hypothetical protein